VADDLGRLRERFTYGLRLVLVLMLPAGAAIALLAGPLVELVLERGALDAASSDTIAGTLAAFAVGLPFFAAYLYAMRGFYALRDTRTPFWINVGENALNIVLAVAFVGPFGVQGLAASFSAAYVVFSFVALVALQRRIGPWCDRRAVVAILRLVVATIALAAVIGGILLVWGTSVPVAFAAGLAGTVTYVLALLVLRAEELSALVHRLKRR
jgi:putative peptidoglycan lipid II flippase